MLRQVLNLILRTSGGDPELMIAMAGVIAESVLKSCADRDDQTVNFIATLADKMGVDVQFLDEEDDDGEEYATC